MGINSIVVALVMMVVVTVLTKGQDIPGCGTNLAACINYININLTTKPPSSCCDTLTKVAVKETSCICNLYKARSYYESYSINFTQAIRLPSLCGIVTDLTTCTQGERNKTASMPAISSGPPTDDENSSRKNKDKQSLENNALGDELSRIRSRILLFWTSIILFLMN